MSGKYDRPTLCGDDVNAQEQELLVRLMEEAGELIQACAKTLRWGWNSWDPTIPATDDASESGGRELNREYVRRELKDLLKLANRLDLQDVNVDAELSDLRNIVASYGKGSLRKDPVNNRTEIRFWLDDMEVREASGGSFLLFQNVIQHMAQEWKRSWDSQFKIKGDR